MKWTYTLKSRVILIKIYFLLYNNSMICDLDLAIPSCSRGANSGQTSLKCHYLWRIQVVWETGILVWAPKLLHRTKHFQVFYFSVVFQQEMCWSGDQWFHNASLYFEMAENTKMQTEEKNNEAKRLKRNKKLARKVFSLV